MVFKRHALQYKKAMQYDWKMVQYSNEIDDVVHEQSEKWQTAVQLKSFEDRIYIVSAIVFNRGWNLNICQSNADEMQSTSNPASKKRIICGE